MREPWPQRMSHPQAKRTAQADHPEGSEGIMPQPVRCEILVLGSDAAGPSLDWSMAIAGEHTDVVARQRPTGGQGTMNTLITIVTKSGLLTEDLSTRTKIFLCVTILSKFVNSQLSHCTTLINKKDMFTGAIYSKFKPRNSQLAP